MSFALFRHDSELAGADNLARLSHRGVGSINVHVSQTILDFKSFEVQGIRHPGAVGHSHAVRTGVLVTKVVDILTTNLNDANVIDVQDCTLILFPVLHALLAINVCIKGRVSCTELRILVDEVLDRCLLVKGDSYVDLPQASQVIRKATLETVLCCLVVPVPSAANKVPVVATYITVMTDFEQYLRPVP